MNNTAQQVLALAALCQAGLAVQRVARQGDLANSELELLLGSLLQLNPSSTEAIYGNDPKLLRAGYQQVIDILSPGNSKNVELVKYCGGLVQLERKLSASPQTLAQLADRLGDMERRLAHFDLTDGTMIAAFADIYASLISPLGPKIQIFGEPPLLQQAAVQHKVRALLLAGLRAAVLWRQLGGRRRQFFFGKRKIIAQAKQALI